ncbi:MAG: metallophosphoesterase [Myxococcota bacterium]
MNAWVLSDIHANRAALDAALAQVDADPAPIIILGDLLTYGPDPCAVLDRLSERSDVSHWVLGNHDELYLGLLAGTPPPSYHRVPDWLRATIDWTCERIETDGAAAAWLRTLPFVREHVDNGILFAHANPFGNWRYVDRDEEHREAAGVLARRGFSVGVFGHTHRGRLFTDPPRSRSPGPDRLVWGPRSHGTGTEVRILNAGSVGQPRNRTGTSTILRLRGTGRSGEASLSVLHYDVAKFLMRLDRMPLPESTVDRLGSFFAAAFATAG